ncbi:MAG: alpha/beta hydrolase family protein [Microthrixaceae bacterium]
MTVRWNTGSRWVAAAMFVAALGLAACSGGDGSDAATTTTSPAESTPADDPVAAATDWQRPACETGPIEPVPVEAVEGIPSDVVMTSFDGTRIRAHWFPHPDADADDPVPTVLMGPGWSLPGDTEVDAVGILGAIDIASLRGAGYNVLTWDPRGFGDSDGVATVNDPAFEGRDVQRLLDWISSLPEVRLDGEGDPQVGMAGGSYGGGIQFVTAAIDCRVDASVPMIAWHSLGTSLYRSELVKTGWAGVLADLPTGATVDPHIDSAYAAGLATGVLSDEDRDWFLSRGPAELVGDVRVPTLIVQGTVDTLFTLDEALTNLEILEASGVPSAMLWYCGGHGMCLTDPGDVEAVVTATIAWLDRWVKGDESVDTGERIDLLDQFGERHRGDTLPAATSVVDGLGSGHIDLVVGGGSGPARAPVGSTEVLDSVAASVTPARATNAIEVEISIDDEALLVGPPELSLTYQGTSPAGERPTRLFAQLVDDTTGLVLGNQITPVPVELDGELHELTLPLESISHSAPAGSSITLQLVATTVAYATPRLGGSVEVESIRVALPVVEGLRRTR